VKTKKEKIRKGIKKVYYIKQHFILISKMKCISFISFILIHTLYNFIKSEPIISCTESKTIAITFDDGPWTYTRQLVDYLLSKPDIEVTFFTVGMMHYPFAYETPEYQEVMKKAHDNGFQIASHTFNHKISNITEEFSQSLTDQENLIEKVTGDRPHYFRAPKGNCDEQCEAILNERGYRTIKWDVDPSDWDNETSGSEQQRVIDSINILQQVFAENRDNYLILLHDTEAFTVSQILPWIIEESGMQEKGYRFVTVAECLGEKEYMYTSGKTYQRADVITDQSSQNITSGAFSQNLYSFLYYLLLVYSSFYFIYNIFFFKLN